MTHPSPNASNSPSPGLPDGNRTDPPCTELAATDLSDVDLSDEAARAKQNASRDQLQKESNFFAVAMVLLFLLACTSSWSLHWLRGLGSQAGHPAREYLGTLRQLSYVGGLGTHTQIQTETQTLLLRGPVLLKNGVRLERRESLLSVQVCEVDSDACWDLLGH